MNLSENDAFVYKGKQVNGKATVLKMNEKMGMIKGYSSITVVNSSTLFTINLTILSPEA